MQKHNAVVCLCLTLLLYSCRDSSPDLYTIGIIQMNNAPTLTQTRKGFVDALAEQGLLDSRDIQIWIENGQGKIPEVQKIAEGFTSRKVNMLVALSTPSLQAALHATEELPIVFASVANPLLAGAGLSAEDHRRNVAGISSEGPIRQSLAFIKSLLPETQRIGTLWTPSELNSNYYLEIARDGAAELGLEIVAVPITNASEVLLSAQILINKKIDVIYQISDNTINQSFQAVGKIAVDNGIPLFGGFLSSTESGACAALGWDFYDMGYKAGKIAIRIKNGESPGDIPFQHMDRVLLHINLEMAEKQGIVFPDDVLARADRILETEGPTSDTSENSN
jgi:putative ABC transport system substrate-binding protein